MEMELERSENFIFSVIIMHSQGTINVFDVNPHCICQVLYNYVCDFPILGINV
jgi:hypothetical protein